jgi:hypothetical protein
MRNDHDIPRCLPAAACETPVKPPLLVMTLEQNDIGPLTHLVHKVRLEISHSAMNGVRFNNGRPITQGEE